ncbi:MAG: cysteine hydrolase family protein [Sedimentisphaerales bacterium]
MILQLVKARRRQILIDIDTQRDFLLASGKACIRNHRRVLAHIRRVMAWARSRNIPIISTCEVYPNNNNNNQANHCCIDGTEGQKKIRYTLLSNKVSFAADGNTDLPRDMLRQFKQIILHKRCMDPFDEPRIDRLLSEVRAGEFVLIGACAEGAVKATALGLLQRDKNVTVVVDAVGSHDKKESQMALRKMEAKGARLTDTKSLAGTSNLKLVGICDCESCQGKTRKTPVSMPEKN